MGTLSEVIAWSCWGLFGGVWIVGALYNWRHSPRTQIRAGPGLLWLILVAAGWVAFRLLPQSDTRSLVAHGNGLQVAGIVLLLGATAFTLWARVALGTMWSSAPLVRQEHELRTGGPYAITRHPIYTGVLGMLAGTALINGLGPWAVAFVLAVIGLEVKLREEERLMAGAFGNAYEQYRRTVPQLVPGLYLFHGIRDR